MPRPEGKVFINHARIFLDDYFFSVNSTRISLFITWVPRKGKIIGKHNFTKFCSMICTKIRIATTLFGPRRSGDIAPYVLLGYEL